VTTSIPRVGIDRCDQAAFSLAYFKGNNCGPFCFLDASIGAIQRDRSKRYDREQAQQACSEHTRKEKIRYEKEYMVQTWWSSDSGPAAARLAVPSGQGAPILTTVVQDQQCQGGDFVNVTLSATLSPPGAKRAVSVGLQQRRGL
jgi:hypothetical protein